MLKVNEFEHGMDGPYHVHKSFQQLYGPETNYSYRADSTDEILGDDKKLIDMIMDHYQVQCPRLAALDNYMKARNDGIYDDDSRRIEDNRADHRVAHNFAKVINVFDVGYNTGVPIEHMSCSTRMKRIRPYLRSVTCSRHLSAMGWTWSGHHCLLSGIRDIGTVHRNG